MPEKEYSKSAFPGTGLITSILLFFIFTFFIKNKIFFTYFGLLLILISTYFIRLHNLKDLAEFIQIFSLNRFFCNF